MEFKKNDVVTVKIEDMSHDGSGIGKADGYTLFIKDAVIGDEVEAKIMKTKKNYGFARLMNVLVPSPDRTEPKCPKARACGDASSSFSVMINSWSSRETRWMGTCAISEDFRILPLRK